jgi:hypothetical protein
MIAVFNPSSIFRIYPQERVLVNEKVLSHFTEFGHEIVGGRLENIILDLAGGNALVQVLANSDRHSAQIGIHGVGDAIYGSLTVHQEAIRQSRASYISTSDHSLSRHLRPTITQYSDSQAALRGIFHEHSYRFFKDVSFCFTNKKPRYQISDTDRDFVLQSLFDYDTHTINRLDDLLNGLSLPIGYSVVHLRFGDELAFGDDLNFTRNEELFEKIVVLFESAAIEKSVHVIMSDSYQFQEYIVRKGFIAARGPIGHAGTSDFSHLQVEKMLIDMRILLGAKEIHQASCYNWGSGFSSSIAEIAKIPIRQLTTISSLLGEYRDGCLKLEF